MSLVRWRPRTALRPLWDDIETIFDRFFADFGMPRLMWREDWRWPSVDVFDEDSQVVIKAEVPGLSKEDVEVTATQDAISISGEKKEESEVKEDNYYRRERRVGGFRRVIPLPEGVNPEEAKAKYRDGVLEIRIPRTEAKPVGKKVEIE